MIAHELAHIRNRDILTQSVAALAHPLGRGLDVLPRDHAADDLVLEDEPVDLVDGIYLL